MRSTASSPREFWMPMRSSTSWASLLYPNSAMVVKGVAVNAAF